MEWKQVRRADYNSTYAVKARTHSRVCIYSPLLIVLYSFVVLESAYKKFRTALHRTNHLAHSAGVGYIIYIITHF